MHAQKLGVCLFAGRLQELLSVSHLPPHPRAPVPTRSKLKTFILLLITPKLSQFGKASVVASAPQCAVSEVHANLILSQNLLNYNTAHNHHTWLFVTRAAIAIFLYEVAIVTFTCAHAVVICNFLWQIP